MHPDTDASGLLNRLRFDSVSPVSFAVSSRESQISEYVQAEFPFSSNSVRNKIFTKCV